MAKKTANKKTVAKSSVPREAKPAEAERSAVNGKGKPAKSNTGAPAKQSSENAVGKSKAEESQKTSPARAVDGKKRRIVTAEQDPAAAPKAASDQPTSKPKGSKPKAPKPKTPKAESKAHEAPEEAHTALSKAAKGEGKAGKSESKAAKSESKASKSEGKAAKGESKAAKGESKAAKGESKAAKGEGKAAKSEGKATEPEADPRVVSLDDVRRRVRARGGSRATTPTASDSEFVNSPFADESPEAEPDESPGDDAPPKQDTSAVADEATEAESAESDDAEETTEAASIEALLGAHDEAGEPEEELSEEAENQRYLKGQIEALLFSSDRSLTVRELARSARIDRKRTAQLLKELHREYRYRGMNLYEISGGFSFRSNPRYSEYIQKALALRPVRLSRAQLETLSIIAYRQPVTRPEVDDIRGVDSGQVLKGLMERDLIKILGKKDEPGRPMLYGTTPAFLELFSLESLKDLPNLREFAELNEESRQTFQEQTGETAPSASVEGDDSGVEGDDPSVAAELEGELEDDASLTPFSAATQGPAVESEPDDVEPDDVEPDDVEPDDVAANEEVAAESDDDGVAFDGSGAPSSGQTFSNKADNDSEPAADEVDEASKPAEPLIEFDAAPNSDEP